MNSMDEETVDNNYVMELLDVSGILFLSLDEELHTYKFADHIKIKIIFDKKVVNGKNDSHLTNICERTVESKPEAITRDSFEDNDSIAKDTCVINSDFNIFQNSTNSQEAVQTTFDQHEDDKGNGKETKMYNPKDIRGIAQIPIFKGKVLPAKFRLKKAVVKLTPLETAASNKSDFKGEENTVDSKLPKTSKTPSGGQETEIKVKKREIKENIQCQFCNKCFNNRKEHNNHQKLERKNYRCEICHRNLRFQAYLMIHERNKLIETDTEETSKGSLKFNVGMHRKTCESRLRFMKSLNCHICGITVSSIKNLKAHTLVHTGEYQYKCCVCGRHVRSHSTLKRHLERHFKFRFKKEVVKLTPLETPTSDKISFQGEENAIASKPAETSKIPSGQKPTEVKVKKREIKENIQCQFCNKCFNSWKDHHNHLKLERKNYRCEICHSNLRFQAYLMIHEQNKIIETNNGEQTSNGSLNLNPGIHRETCESRLKFLKSLKCHICGITVSDLKNLKTHTLVHTGEYQYKCCVCGRHMRAHGTLKKHLERHFKYGQVECKICHLTFSNRAELSKHRRLKHALQCGLCGEEFPNRTVRKFHYKTCHKEDILKCPQCGGLYSCQEELARHLKEHNLRPQTQCPVCGVFVSVLRKHMLSRHGTNVKESSNTNNIYICDKCSRQFSNKYSFQSHMQTHSEEKRYKCSVCSKQFARCGALSKHMRIHMDEKPFVCEICGKGCNQPGNLKVHMRTHRTHSVLRCRHCGLSFSQKDDLEEHITSTHLGKGNVEGSAVQFLQASQAFF